MTRRHTLTPEEKKLRDRLRQRMYRARGTENYERRKQEYEALIGKEAGFAVFPGLDANVPHETLRARYKLLHTEYHELRLMHHSGQGEIQKLLAENLELRTQLSKQPQ